MAAPISTRVPEECWQLLIAKGELRNCGPDTVLFRSGTLAEGIYLVEKGRVNLRLACPDDKNRKKKKFGKTGPGTILGLSEAMSGGHHKLTAETATAAEICFLERQQLLEFLRTTPHACLQVVQLLSEDLHRLYHTFRRQT